ncbi:MAG: TolC family protein [Bacteroidales bacterium]|nr:TolC family protein [Bacteroidales bacterium]
MKKFCLIIAGVTLFSAVMSAQETVPADSVAVSGDSVLVLNLENALKVALSENVSVKVADKEVKRTEYAKKGTYAALFPKIDANASFQRTIKKQVMYMDVSIPGMSGGGASSGIEVGRWNTWSAGVSASMPLVSAQLWESIRISGLGVELAVEKARSSRLEAVTQTKKAYFAVLLAKEVADLYKLMFENALANFQKTELKYKVQKVSEVDYLRSKTTLNNTIPDVYNSQVSVALAIWQLKAVIGLDLDTDVEVVGNLLDYADDIFSDSISREDYDVSSNSSMKQLAIQAEQLRRTIKLQQNANIPTLALAFNFNYNAMTNDFNFKEYKWTPYSYVGLSLSIPIFAGGKRAYDIRQAKNQYEQVSMTMDETERQLKIAIRNCLLTMDTSIKSYSSAEVAVETATKSFKIVETSYQVGRATITDLDDARLALLQAALSKTQAVYTYISTKADLEQILGVDYSVENE